MEFEWLGHPLVFVGARRAQDGDDEASAFEAAAAGLAGTPPSDPLEALARLAGGSPGLPDHFELGAANAWRSVGPLRLWSRGGEPPLGRVGPLLDGRPDLRACSAPVALAVGFEQPRSCWIGRELSRPDGDRHLVDAAAVEAVLAGLFAD